MRNTSGHTFRVVNSADCPNCASGAYGTLPTSSLTGWTDVDGMSNKTYTFTEGSYYYVCTSHSNMVGTIQVTECIDTQPAGQIGMCNNARGVCECLPPFTTIEYQNSIDWKGKPIVTIDRAFTMPIFDRVTTYRLRMMQGAESYVKNALEVITVNETIINITYQGDSLVWKNTSDATIPLCTNAVSYTHLTLPTNREV